MIHSSDPASIDQEQDVNQKSGDEAYSLDLICRPPTSIEAGGWIRQLCSEHQFGEDDIFRVELCVHELAQNIVSYSNPNKSPCELHLRVQFTSSQVVLVVSDQGVPYDPIQAPPPPEIESLNDLETGGLGLHLVRQFVDNWSYQRQKDKNVLTLIVDIK